MALHIRCLRVRCPRGGNVSFLPRMLVSQEPGLVSWLAFYRELQPNTTQIKRNRVYDGVRWWYQGAFF
jgi:hypothetical protein